MFFGAARRDRVGTAVSLRHLRDRRSSLPGITRRITWLRLLSSHVSGYRGALTGTRRLPPTSAAPLAVAGGTDGSSGSTRSQHTRATVRDRMTDIRSR